MANPERTVDSLEVPRDIAKKLDTYAETLSGEYLFPVTRQQAFERFMRAMLLTGASNG